MPVNAPEIIKVKANTNRIECNGGGGALGHPRVFYSFDGRDTVTCGYCDREFTKVKPKKAR